MDMMHPAAKTLTGVCLLACTVLTHEVTRVVQDAPQRVEEVTAYEWCIDPPKGLFLVRRTYWRVDRKQTTRNERTDTPSSHSQVLWGRGNEADQDQ